LLDIASPIGHGREPQATILKAWVSVVKYATGAPQGITLGWNPCRERGSAAQKTAETKKRASQRLTLVRIASIMKDKIPPEPDAGRLPGNLAVAMSMTAIMAKPSAWLKEPVWPVLIVPQTADGLGNPTWQLAGRSVAQAVRPTRPRFSVIAARPYQQCRRCG